MTASTFKATAFEFRFRVPIIGVWLSLGFWSPGFHTRTVWSSLSLLLTRHGMGMEGAALGIGYFAAVLAVLGALLRTWATAYLGAEVVHDRAMHSSRVVADGPYRHVRNPLYAGSELGFLAAAVLMPVYGAVFFIALTLLLFWRIMLREEWLLAGTPGYPAYRDAVPRVLFSPLPRVAPAGTEARWLQAIVGEIFPWGIAISFALFVPRFNAMPIIQGITVGFGVSLILRALGVKSLG